MCSVYMCACCISFAFGICFDHITVSVYGFSLSALLLLSLAMWNDVVAIVVLLAKMLRFAI